MSALADPITEAQRRLPPLAGAPRTRQQYRRTARWWELEARRGLASRDRSLAYARNMRWAAEFAGLLGDGTWRELVARAGVKNPAEGR